MSSNFIKQAAIPHRDESGQSAQEFHLVLPIFVAAFPMVIDLGMLMYQFVSVSNAVREGTRYGSINCGDGECDLNDVKDRTINHSSGIISSHGEVDAYWMDNNGDGSHYNRGDSVVVTVEKDYDFLFFPGSIPVTSCAAMSLENSGRRGIPFLKPITAARGCHEG